MAFGEKQQDMSKLFIVDFFDGINSTSLNELRKRKKQKMQTVLKENYEQQFLLQCNFEEGVPKFWDTFFEYIRNG